MNSHLAKEIVRDGEGAGKFIEVQVKGTKTKEDARILAKSIITSNLVKTAFLVKTPIGAGFYVPWAIQVSSLM